PLSPNGKLERKALPKPEAASAGGFEPPRTVMEQQLSQLWADALQLPRVGIDDDFFALGGHSILMLGLLERIHAVLGQRLSLAEFMAHPTVRGQCDILRRRGSALPTTRVVMSKGVEGAPKLFCLPPAGGVVFAYYPLAHRLAGDFEVVGVLHRSIVEADYRYEDWDAMVDGFLADIEAEQPQGPYHLLGWSSGGLLAMAIANRLESKGQVVRWLGLVDSTLPPQLNGFYSPSDPEVCADPQVGEQAELAALVKGFFPEKDMQYVARMWQDALSQGRVPIEHVLADLAAEKGLALESFQHLYEVQKQAAEMAIGFQVFDQVTALQKAAQIQPLKVLPACWWSAESYSDPVGLQQAFGQMCLANGYRVCCLMDVSHDWIVRSPAFINELISDLAVLPA
ncbi:MAG: thioesterase domain-containing protein, partial [Pseudomonas putida]